MPLFPFLHSPHMSTSVPLALSDDRRGGFWNKAHSPARPCAPCLGNSFPWLVDGLPVFTVVRLPGPERSLIYGPDLRASLQQRLKAGTVRVMG